MHVIVQLGGTLMVILLRFSGHGTANPNFTEPKLQKIKRMWYVLMATQLLRQIQLKLSGVKGKGPGARLAYTTPRKTLIGIVQVRGTRLLRDLRGLAKELPLTALFVGDTMDMSATGCAIDIDGDILRAEFDFSRPFIGFVWLLT
uniref:Uncharacterized protein n=1 Tax=Romanomermis culicivorax TaxID=13658 RepID=A0A915KP19_ROMCU